MRDRTIASGLQLYVEHRGQIIVDDAWGSCAGRRLERDSVHSAFCSTKPLLPLVVAKLVSEGHLNYEADLRQRVPAATWLRTGTSVAQVLVHAAALGSPTAALWRMTPRDRRAALLSDPTDDYPWQYSEVAGWLALEMLVEVCTGVEASRVVEEQLLTPLGIEGHILVSCESALQALRDRRIRVPVGGLPDDEVPMLSEQLPAQVAEASPAFGGLVSMHGLGVLFSALRRAYGGDQVDGLPSPTALRTLMLLQRDGSVPDKVLGRPAPFAGGFMSDLETHGISDELSADAFGHAAGITNSLAFTDPRLELSVALYMNGSTLGVAGAAGERRRIVDQIVTITTGRSHG